LVVLVAPPLQAVAMGRPSLDSFDQTTKAIWHNLSQQDLCEVLAKGDYDIVHYVGHSNAAGNAERGCA
jgi:hypothetical protein